MDQQAAFTEDLVTAVRSVNAAFQRIQAVSPTTANTLARISNDIQAAHLHLGLKVSQEMQMARLPEQQQGPPQPDGLAGTFMRQRPRETWIQTAKRVLGEDGRESLQELSSTNRPLAELAAQELLPLKMRMTAWDDGVLESLVPRIVAQSYLGAAAGATVSSAVSSGRQQEQHQQQQHQQQRSMTAAPPSPLRATARSFVPRASPFSMTATATTAGAAAASTSKVPPTTITRAGVQPGLIFPPPPLPPKPSSYPPGYSPLPAGVIRPPPGFGPFAAATLPRPVGFAESRARSYYAFAPEPSASQLAEQKAANSRFGPIGSGRPQRAVPPPSPPAPLSPVARVAESSMQPEIEPQELMMTTKSPYGFSPFLPAEESEAEEPVAESKGKKAEKVPSPAAEEVAAEMGELPESDASAAAKETRALQSPQFEVSGPGSPAYKTWAQKAAAARGEWTTVAKAPKSSMKTVTAATAASAAATAAAAEPETSPEARPGYPVVAGARWVVVDGLRRNITMREVTSEISTGPLVEVGIEQRSGSLPALARIAFLHLDHARQFVAQNADRRRGGSGSGTGGSLYGAGVIVSLGSPYDGPEALGGMLRPAAGVSSRSGLAYERRRLTVVGNGLSLTEMNLQNFITKVAGVPVADIETIHCFSVGNATVVFARVSAARIVKQRMNSDAGVWQGCRASFSADPCEKPVSFLKHAAKEEPQDRITLIRKARLRPSR